jgi:hypothetical protein
MLVTPLLMHFVFLRDVCLLKMLKKHQNQGNFLNIGRIKQNCEKNHLYIAQLTTKHRKMGNELSRRSKKIVNVALASKARSLFLKNLKMYCHVLYTSQLLSNICSIPKMWFFVITLSLSPASIKLNVKKATESLLC